MMRPSLHRPFRHITLLIILAATVSVAANEAQRAIVIRTAAIKKAPSFAADTLTVLPVGHRVELGSRVGGWQKVTIMPESKQAGWLRTYQVRSDITSSPSVVQKRSSERGVLSGLSSLSRSTASLFGQREMSDEGGNMTATIGVRGLSEADLENARPDAGELQRMKTYSVAAQSARQFAQAGGLQVQKIKELPEPKKSKKAKKKAQKKDRKGEKS